MADLPRYGTQTARAGIQDIGVHRMRGLEDAGYAALQTSRTAADASETLMRQVERANIAEAEQSGNVVARDEYGNLKPIALRDSSSPSSVAYNNAQRQAWTSAAAASAASQLKVYAHQSLNPTDEAGNPLSVPPDPIKAFDAQASGYMAAARKDPKMPDDVRSALVTRIGQIAAEHRTWIVDQVRDRNLKQMTSQLTADGNRILGEGIAHARSGNDAAAGRSRNDFVAAITGIADIDPSFGKDKQDGAIKAFDAAIYFSGIERKALAAFNGASGFRESGLGRAAGIRVVEAASNDAIAKFGPDLAKAWGDRVNQKIQLEASLRDSVDNVQMRRADEAYLAASLRFSEPVIAALKGNGKNPQTVLQEQSDRIFQQFKDNPRLASLFQNRFVHSFHERAMDWSPSVIGANQSQSEWFSSIKQAVARGDIDPQSVVPMMLNEFEASQLPWDPKFEAAVRSYASTAEVAGINRDNAEARAGEKEFERRSNANAVAMMKVVHKQDDANAKRLETVQTVAAALDGKANPFQVNSAAAKALDEVWSEWKWKPETHAPMMVEMMLRGGGLSADVKDELRGLITQPTESMARKYAPMLGLMMQAGIKPTLIDKVFHTSEDRQRLERIWSEIQQHEVTMRAAGSDAGQQQIERKRFGNSMESMSTAWANAAISVPELRARMPNFDSQVAVAAGKQIAELSSVGIDALDGWLGFSKTPGVRVFGSDVQAMKPFQSGYNINLDSKVAQSAVEGLSLVLGSNPFSGMDVAAGLPIIGWLFEKAPVTMNVVDQARLKANVTSRAVEMGGDIDGAAVNAKRAFAASGYQPSFYSGANNKSVFNKDAKYVAEWTHEPIDGGPGGPLIARAVLAPIAAKLINSGFKFADETATNAINAVSKPGLWNVKFDSYGTVPGPDGRPVEGRSYNVMALANTGLGEITPVPVGRVFVPTINDNVTSRIRADAEIEAQKIVTERYAREPAKPSESMLRGQTQEQLARQLLDPFRMQTGPDGKLLSDSAVVAAAPKPQPGFNEIKMLAKWLEMGMVVDHVRTVSTRAMVPSR